MEDDENGDIAFIPKGLKEASDDRTREVMYRVKEGKINVRK